MGSSTRQKLENSKGYAESPEFSPAPGLIIFGEKCQYKIEVNWNPSSLNYKKKLYTYTRTPTRLHYPAHLRARVIKILEIS